jgi:tetratricopeptide (TPR) repeat protein
VPLQQLEESFLGRTREIEIFNRWLVDPEAPWILYFHDELEKKEKKGGIGKTWLLKKCAELARQQRPEAVVVMIDFFNLIYRDGLAIAERVVQELQAAYPHWTARDFTHVLTEHRKSRPDESVEGAEIRVDLARSLQADLKRLEPSLGEAKKSLLLFFDTFELIEHNPIVAILNYARTFPDNYYFDRVGVVFAGRNKLDWSHANWRGRENEVWELALAPFSQAETLEYLQRESIYDPETPPEQAQALYRRTEGRPILIGLVADVLNQRIMTVEKLIQVPQESFEAHLVTQINHLENPLNWVILFMAHVYHRFNIVILNWILREAKISEFVQEISPEELLARLSQLSFVRASSSGDDLVLHDEMRRLVNQYCWVTQDADLRLRKEISRCMLGYYEQEMANMPLEQERQAYTAEVLHHRLFLDVAEGFDYFQRNFEDAFFKEQIPLANALLQEAQQFTDLLSAGQRSDLEFAEARLLRSEEDVLHALEHLQTLEQEADEDWMALNRSALLEEVGRCHLFSGNFTEAIDHFKRQLELEQEQGNELRVAKALYWLGFTDRSRGQFDDAIAYYEQSIDIYQRLDKQQEYANTLNNISFIYKLRGRTEEALRKCQLGLRIREGLFRAGEISEYPLGLSLSTMGQIYLDAGHFVWGGDCFDKAFEIYTRLGRRKELAATYNRFGLIQIAKSDLRQAAAWFMKAEEASVDLHPEAYITSLNKQGLIHKRQGQWQEALNFFQKSLEKAREANDRYQYVENLIDLAEAQSHLQQEEQAQRNLQEAEEIASRWDYFLLLGHLKEVQGDILFRDGKYEDAFHYYGEYCRYLAKHNRVEYNQATRKVMDQFFATPKERVPAIVDAFIAYWTVQGLEKDYPDMIQSLEDTREARLLG